MVIVRIDVAGGDVFINPEQITSVAQAGAAVKINMVSGESFIVNGTTPSKFMAGLGTAEYVAYNNK
jgi:hypothetical protein